jgi:hypothetical protein
MSKLAPSTLSCKWTLISSNTLTVSFLEKMIVFSRVVITFVLEFLNIAHINTHPARIQPAPVLASTSSTRGPTTSRLCLLSGLFFGA